MIPQAENIDPRIHLRDLLNRHLTLDDIITLCFDLGIDYENLAGDIKRTKIENLIMQVGQTKRLPDLIGWVKTDFSHLDWPIADWDRYEWALIPFSTVPSSPYQNRPKALFEPSLTYVPAGHFYMGRDDGPPEEGPLHEINLPGFWISTEPISNEAFGTYIWKSGKVASSAMLWDGNVPPAGRERDSVVGVTWEEAAAFCSWLSAESGRGYRLPTEAEWEKSIRGTAGGNEPAGVARLNGIREWTATAWGRKSSQPDPQFAYPWRNDMRNALDLPPTVLRVYRGHNNQSTARGGYNPTKPGPKRSRHGFRVVCDQTE